MGIIAKIFVWRKKENKAPLEVKIINPVTGENLTPTYVNDSGEHLYDVAELKGIKNKAAGLKQVPQWWGQVYFPRLEMWEEYKMSSIQTVDDLKYFRCVGLTDETRTMINKIENCLKENSKISDLRVRNIATGKEGKIVVAHPHKAIIMWDGETLTTTEYFNQNTIKLVSGDSENQPSDDCLEKAFSKPVMDEWIKKTEPTEEQ